MPYKKSDLFKAYALDWILCIVFLGAFYGLDRVEPHHRLFSLEDKTIQYPFAVKERVPMWLCGVVTVVFPFVAMSFTALVIKKSSHDWHHASLGLLMSFTLTLMVTALFKNTVGRPRPDFIDRCQPSEVAVDPLHGLNDDSICTRKDLLRDGFKSFLSGHSSTAFAGMGFLSLYFAGKLHVFDRKGYTYKGFVVAAPLLVAILIAVSRTQDYRHHWQDVVAGGFIGFLISFYSYHQYYPSLHSAESDKPFSVRLKKVRPEYHKASFNFLDGSNIAITVVKNESEVVDAGPLIATDSTSNSSQAQVPLVV